MLSRRPLKRDLVTLATFVCDLIASRCIPTCLPAPTPPQVQACKFLLFSIISGTVQSSKWGQAEVTFWQKSYLFLHFMTCVLVDLLSS